MHSTAKLFAVYQQPKDPVAFDSYYFGKHVPLAKTIPGLKSYEVTTGDVMGMAGKHNVYLVAVLEFESMAAIGAAMASPQGRSTSADLANFASAGVEVMMGETKRVQRHSQSTVQPMVQAGRTLARTGKTPAQFKRWTQ